MANAKGVNVRDTVLWVEDTGETELPPVLCLHSLFLDGTMFGALAAAAAGRYRVIRPDFRGQGRSAPATGDIVDMEACAADIEALIELMGLKDVNLVVQSMGGDVALAPGGAEAGLTPCDGIAWHIGPRGASRTAGTAPGLGQRDFGYRFCGGASRRADGGDVW